MFYEKATQIPALFRAYGHPEEGQLTLFNAILREQPQLRGQPYTESSGATAATVIYPGAVYKGATSEESTLYIDQEYNALHHMAGKVAHIPQALYLGRDTYFFGMTHIPGVSLYSSEEHGFTNIFNNAAQAENAGAGIAAMAFEVAAAFSPQDADRILVMKHGLHSNPRELVKRLEEQAENPCFKAYARAAIKAVGDYADSVEGRAQAVIHADLSMENIRMNNNTFSGVIDFGYMNKTWPEGAFARLFYDYDKSAPLIEAACAKFNEKSGSRITAQDVGRHAVAADLDCAFRMPEDADQPMHRGFVNRAIESLKLLKP